MIYSFYVLSRSGVCLLQEDFPARKRFIQRTRLEEQKVLAGLLFTLQQFSKQVSPTANNEGFRSYSTDTYRLHAILTPTGYWFVLTTDRQASDQRDTLRYIYATLFTEHVLHSPLFVPGEPLASDAFSKAVVQHLRSLPVFGSTSAAQTGAGAAPPSAGAPAPAGPVTSGLAPPALAAPASSTSVGAAGGTAQAQASASALAAAAAAAGSVSGLAI